MPTLNLRISDDLSSQIDTACGAGSKSDFLRIMIERALSSPPSAAQPAPYVRASPSDKEPTMADNVAELSAALAGKRRTCRDLSKEMGWNLARVDVVVEHMGKGIKYMGNGILELMAHRHPQSLEIEARPRKA